MPIDTKTKNLTNKVRNDDSVTCLHQNRNHFPAKKWYQPPIYNIFIAFRMNDRALFCWFQSPSLCQKLYNTITKLDTRCPLILARSAAIILIRRPNKEYGTTCLWLVNYEASSLVPFIWPTRFCQDKTSNWQIYVMSV